MTHQRVGTFEMPGATSKFRPTGTAVVCIYIYQFDKQNSFIIPSRDANINGVYD